MTAHVPDFETLDSFIVFPHWEVVHQRCLLTTDPDWETILSDALNSISNYSHPEREDDSRILSSSQLHSYA